MLLIRVSQITDNRLQVCQYLYGVQVSYHTSLANRNHKWPDYLHMATHLSTA